MEEKKTRTGYITIIGRPNVGKSTLMNRIIGQKIAITSNKPQTTRNRIQTVYTDDRGQIVFLDTPGMNRARNRLGEFMLNAALNTLEDADAAMWIVEPSDAIGNNEQFIMNELGKHKLPVILVINKTDMVRTEDVLESIKMYSSAFEFSAIVPVSAREGDNVDELIKVLFEHLPEGPLYYDEDTLTDQPIKQIAAEIIREKALHCLDNEVPHGIAVIVDLYKERFRSVRTMDDSSYKEPVIDIEATLICEKESHKGIVIGKGGAMLKKIGTSARYEIENLADAKVNLKLWVKVRKDWRDSDTQLRNFGYDTKH
ncbi:MAG: GTPase Era [Parasporobacterium sp.]|nr:GTPase Era [Parasporobacterium sp.]